MTPDRYATARRQQSARRRFEARELLSRLKEGKCKDCGRDDLLPCQMDLVFADGSGPGLASLLNRSKERILGAARGTDLVCACCSRLRAWKASRARRSGPT